MRSVAITRLGGPEVLELREGPDPVPGPGQILVRVKAAGLNFADVLMRMGQYPGAPEPPFTPGYEVAGLVERLGPGAAGWREGDRVLAATEFGGYCDRVVVPAAHAFAIPEGRSFEAAAAFPVNYLTAYMAIVAQAGARAGETVLVHGAAGGVGIAALQIAKVLGLKTAGTASASKHEAARKEGLDFAVDYRADWEGEVRRWTGGRGVDIALDPVGGDSFRKSYRLLAPMGRLVCYGFSAAASGPRRNLLRLAWEYLRTPRFSPLALMMENRAVFGLHLGRSKGFEPLLASSMRTLLAWWAEGRLTPRVGAAFALKNAAEAHRYLQDRRSVGKVVLTVE